MFKRSGIIAILVLGLAVFAVNAQLNSDNDRNPYVPSGHTLVNPTTGVTAENPATLDPNVVGTNTVNYSSIGGGDAYLSYVWWPLNYNYGHGETWLENWVPETNVLLSVRVTRFSVASSTISEDDWTERNDATGGSRVHAQLGPLTAQKDDPVGVDTEHKIFKRNIYNWYAPDSDFWYFGQ